MSEGKRELRINCGLAMLLNDRENYLENFSKVHINSGRVLVSSAINAKLQSMGAAINCGDLMIRDIQGELLQLDKGAVIDGSGSFKGIFIVTQEDILVTGEGVKKLEEAEGLISLGKILYPQSANLGAMTKVSGDKQAYPDGAQVFIGNHDLEGILAAAKEKQLWVSGRLRALEKKALDEARAKGITLSCSRLFSYEGLNAEFGDIINAPERTLVPDGYEITGKLKGNELRLYGKKIYVDGSFNMEEKDLESLQSIEGIVVKGKASLPESAVETFRSKGKADSYFIFEGRFVEINGFEQLSHGTLAASCAKGEKLTILVNGCLLFSEDVQAEDFDCIASISYNGTVLLPGSVKAALAGKVKTGNGFMGDPEMLKDITGQSLQDLMSGRGKGSKDEDNDTVINMGTYILA
ncbi:MAG: hypothetical protein FWH12_09370 [Treponema sp.]|nr:hypothetical protein [Treponema sp.]